jgi:Zn-dependent protease with chaperone function
MYIHSSESRTLHELIEWIPEEDSLLQYFRKVEEKKKWPDMLGKTLEADEYQFRPLYDIVNRFSHILGILTPRIFVYEDVYYRAEVNGLTLPWIEISSNLVRDFDNTELEFVIGHQLARIQSRHYHYEALGHSALLITDYVDHIPFINLVNVVYGMDIYQAYLSVYLNAWRRASFYSADACGYLLAGGNMTASVSAALKMVLNNSSMVSEVNLKRYMEKAIELNQLQETMEVGSKLDEAAPYAPYRLLELFRYASSIRAKEVLTTIQARSPL